MKKPLALCASVLSLALALSGCHGGGSQEELMESADMEKTVYYSLDDDHVTSILSQGMEHISE